MNEDWGNGYIPAAVFTGSFFIRDEIHDVHAIGHHAEDGIAPFVFSTIEKVIGFMIDKELLGCSMWAVGARHGYAAAYILQAIL